MQVVELKEYYPKRKRERNLSCWIVTTDLKLPLEEVREAAHQRWQIENNVFKRISHLSGTKRFYFKDPRQFFNLLHLFFAAVAVLDCIIALLRAHRRLFAALRAGIKDTCASHRRTQAGCPHLPHLTGGLGKFWVKPTPVSGHRSVPIARPGRGRAGRRFPPRYRRR